MLADSMKAPYRTAAMEGAAGVSAMKTVLKLEPGYQVPKPSVHAYLHHVWGDVPLSWANVCQAWYRTVDTSHSKSPEKADEKADEKSSSPATPVRKHQRAQVGKYHVAVFDGVKMLSPEHWKPFDDNVVANYLGIAVGDVNERQTVCKGLDLVAMGVERSAEQRKKIAATPSDHPEGKKRKRSPDEPVKNESKPFGVGTIVTDDTGVFLLTPMKTKVTARSNLLSFTQVVPLPEQYQKLEVLVNPPETFDFVPPKPVKPRPEKLKSAETADDWNVYFVPFEVAEECNSVV